MYDHILIPTDGSAGMDRVADHALSIAKLCGATVHVLYVVDDSVYDTIPEDALDQVRAELETEARSVERTVAEQAMERDLPVVTEVRWGNPAEEIIAYAVENDVDLITMGTRGKTGLERYLLGSVAEKVVRISPVPVMTINIGNRDELVAEIADLLDR